MIIALVGHELRSPLGTILSGIKLLARHPLSDESQRVVAMMERQALHASRLVADLIDLSRVSSGTFRVELRPTTADQIVERVIEGCQPLARERSRNLESRLQDGLEPFSGDPDRLVQALRNLVDNAIKFTQTNGLISVRVAATETGIMFSVCDDGVGISPEDLPRLGLPFSQLEAAKEQRSHGLGLGLHIVKSIAEAHGGALFATSDGPSKGSCFSFEVPRRKGSDS
jgi:signal transduction histidine kinase